MNKDTLEKLVTQEDTFLKMFRQKWAIKRNYTYDLEKLEENNLEVLWSLGFDGGAGRTAGVYSDGPSRFGGGRRINPGGPSKRPTEQGGQDLSQVSNVDSYLNSVHSSKGKANGVCAYATGLRRPRVGERTNDMDSDGRGLGRGLNCRFRDHHHRHDQTVCNDVVIDR
ncbi:hypothetical protein FGIG_10726 [Fasciola gigantica]|uniref:Uncharacterized protein n=1 Tax=Fasciola gigantica TaxID=46835 RepID=A0A504YY06_FASGI|nr:hypothetical protein FGIG_10726 [Fasciola gigantica]